MLINQVNKSHLKELEPTLNINKRPLKNSGRRSKLNSITHRYVV